jgi:hypothetical protein
VKSLTTIPGVRTLEWLSEGVGMLRARTLLIEALVVVAVLAYIGAH